MGILRSTTAHMTYDPDKHIPDIHPAKSANQVEAEQKLREASYSLSGLKWEYMLATEWNLATLEGLEELKGSSKSSIARQKRICYDMISVCRVFVQKDHNFPTDHRTGRLMDRLKKLWDSSEEE